MPSDSVDAFYRRARLEALAPGDALDALAADPSLPQAGVGLLAEALAARPDLPAGLLAMVAELRWAAPPADPLPLGEAVESALGPVSRPPAAPTEEATRDDPGGVFVPAEYAPDAAFVPEPADELALDADAPLPRRREPEPETNVKLWIWVDVGLWALAIILWLIYFYQPFSSTPPTERPARSRR